MASEVQNLLRSHGPSVTSELISIMVDSGISESAARQRISRAKPDYIRLAGLRLAKNARFLYLPDQFADEKYWKALERALDKYGKAYWCALTGLKARGGRCLKSQFPMVCGAPLARKGQLSPERILSRLEAINLLKEKEDPISGDSYISFLPGYYPKDVLGEIKAVSLAEFVAIQAIKDWARKLGFGSYNSFLVRGDENLPVVSGVAWDISAPSYIRPLVSARTGTLKPGFLVCDVNIRGVLGEEEVTKFLRKYDMASAPMNVGPILPFLVAGSFTNSAFDKAKSAGILAVTIPNLFGDDVMKALNDLIKLLTDTGATASVNPEHLFNVMSQLTRIEGAANNLRGALFELVIGSLFKDVKEGFLTAGVEIVNVQQGRIAEVDVIFDENDSNMSFVIECKSKIPGSKVSLAEVKKWYADRVPLIAEALFTKTAYKGRKLHFEIWTNGVFHESALNWLNGQKKKMESYSVDWKDGSGIKLFAEQSKNKAIRKILNDHYFKNPMTKIAT